jgi:hypothetical protein
LTSTPVPAARSGSMKARLMSTRAGHLLRQCAAGARDAQVLCDHRGLDAVRRGDLGGEGLQAVPTAGDEHQVGAAGGEPAGELGADPGARAGDQGGLLAVIDRAHDLHCTPLLALSAR